MIHKLLHDKSMHKSVLTHWMLSEDVSNKTKEIIVKPSVNVDKLNKNTIKIVFKPSMNIN